jgi:lysyl-tRNA synthetase class 2
VPGPEDQRGQREHNLRELTALGLPLLPTRFGPICSSAEIKQRFEELEGSRVRVAGRLMRVRNMGKAAFAHLKDGAGEIQLYFKRDLLGDTRYGYFKLLDVGDLIGVEGTVFKTRTGEITIEAHDLTLLAKAYRQLPDKWHGLSDVETRYRRRYLDLISNEQAREIFRIRSAVISGIRRYLDGHGFIEVETPILQPLYGGAAANPFVTHYAALDMPAYLRIADELYLKRLIVGGMERVYEISKDFRNEGFSRKHSPEFTMLELYEAYANIDDIMELTERMVSAVALSVLKSTQVRFDQHDIDLSPPWRRLSVVDALWEYAQLELSSSTSREDLLAAGERLGVDVDPRATRGELVEDLFSALVEPNLIEPTFIIDFPIDFPGSLLARRKPDEPDFVERFELYIGGMELANAFTELNDPADQLARMEEASELAGDEHQAVDWDFILALEHGMPPTGGIGIGLDRLIMILTGAHHIRETILFPLLRQRETSDAEP